MIDLSFAQVTAVALSSAAIYMLPGLIGLSRFGAGARRVVAVNALLGWTVVGWFWALVCALKPPSPRVDRHPEPSIAAAPTLSAPYEEGSYLVSQVGSARLWAVYSGCQWGVVFEVDGLERASAWVGDDQVPFDVLARALRDLRKAPR